MATQSPIGPNAFPVLSSDDHPHKAVILVGGIHNNYTYFNEWKEGLKAPDTAVIGFNHDHQTQSMSAAAHDLAKEIHGLRAQGIEEVTVVAHSMGGLVSKGALNELVREGEAGEFKHLELHTFGTPWGGFALADVAQILPGAETVSQAVGYPMGPEIGPHSAYMKNLAQEWPANMEFHVYSGTTDNVAIPDASSTKERYEAIVGKADSVTLLEDFKHNDYVETGPQVLGAGKGQSVPGMETLSQGLELPYESLTTQQHPHQRAAGAPAEAVPTAAPAQEASAEMSM